MPDDLKMWARKQERKKELKEMVGVFLGLLLIVSVILIILNDIFGFVPSWQAKNQGAGKETVAEQPADTSSKTVRELKSPVVKREVTPKTKTRSTPVSQTYGRFTGWADNCNTDTPYCVVTFTNGRLHEIRLHNKYVCYWADTTDVQTIDRYYEGSWMNFTSIDNTTYYRPFPTLKVKMPNASRTNVGRLYVVRLPNGQKDCMVDHVKFLYDRTMNQHLIVNDAGNEGRG